METAVCTGSARGAPPQFQGCAKIRGLLGKVASTGDKATPNANQNATPLTFLKPRSKCPV
jgi:hypothetical protein